jgi:aldehyde:ferredoxin oxidoreductase
LIARREGFGNSLAEGTARLASKIGKGSQDFAMHVKGLEPGMHDPRMQSNFAMSYMLAANGADHCGSMPDFFMANDFMLSQFHPLGYLTTVTPTDIGPYKVSLWRLGQFMNQLCDSLVVFQFPSFSFESIAETLKAITGWDTGIPELLRIAERNITLMRLFNLREGITSTQDVLPKRFFQPTNVGALANIKIDPELYNRAKQYYYALMGWDQKGVPLLEKVEDLQIS